MCKLNPFAGNKQLYFQLNASPINGSETLLDLIKRSEELMQQEMEALNRYQHLMQHLAFFKKYDDFGVERPRK